MRSNLVGATIDLVKIDEQVEDFVQKREWEPFHSVKNLSMALSVEASELAEIFQWLSEEESNQVKNMADKKERVEEEIADIFIYLMRIAKKTEVDIEKAVLSKIKKNAEKYPVEKSKGSARKYTEL